MEKDRELLRAESVALATGGQWRGLDRLSSAPSGVSLVIERIDEHDLVFLTDPDQWGSKVPDTYSRAAQIIKKKPAALVTNRFLEDLPIAQLVVADTRTALKDLAMHVRDVTQAKRILITGSQGKTGAKLMLGELLMKLDRKVSFSSVSANLDVPVLACLANIRSDDEFALIEVAISDPDVGARRSRYVLPSHTMITNSNPCHHGTHGDIEKMISHKAESVTGLMPGGKVLINSDSYFATHQESAIRELRCDLDIIRFGSSRVADSRLISASWNEARWDVMADVLGEKIRYRLPLVYAHAPVASLAVLTMLKVLGVKIGEVSNLLESVDSLDFISTGEIKSIAFDGRQVTIYDQSYSCNEYSLQSSIMDLERIECEGQQFLVTGGFLDHCRYTRGAIERILDQINHSNIRHILTVGPGCEDYEQLAATMNSKINVIHTDSGEQLLDSLLSMLKPGDTVLVKGQNATRLSDVVAKLELRLRKA